MQKCRKCDICKCRNVEIEGYINVEMQKCIRAGCNYGVLGLGQGGSMLVLVCSSAWSM